MKDFWEFGIKIHEKGDGIVLLPIVLLTNTHINKSEKK